MCGPESCGFGTCVATDNCFFGRPRSLEALLAQFDEGDRYLATYSGLPRSEHPRPEGQLRVAARLARLDSCGLCQARVLAVELERAVVSSPDGVGGSSSTRAPHTLVIEKAQAVFESRARQEALVGEARSKVVERWREQLRRILIARVAACGPLGEVGYRTANVEIERMLLRDHALRRAVRDVWLRNGSCSQNVCIDALSFSNKELGSREMRGEHVRHQLARCVQAHIQRGLR